MSGRRRRRGRPTWAWAAAGLLVASTASASPPRLDPVVVTGKAAWRQGGLTSVDGASWRTLGMPDLPGLLATVPGVQPNRGEPGQSLPVLRGIGTETSGVLLGTQQATTGVYLDGVPLTDLFGFLGTPDFSGFELARLDVLRGPQGVLYGSASLGGAIDVHLVAPRLGGHGHLARATVARPVGGGPGVRLAAALDRGGTAPDGGADRALRLEAYTERAGGLTDNDGTGRVDADARARRGVRLAGVWLPVAGTVLQGQLLSQSGTADDTAAAWPDPRERRTRTPSASWRRDGLDLATLAWSTDLAQDLTLSATGAWVRKQSRRATDLTRSSGPLGRALGPSLGLPPLPDLPLVTSVTLSPTRSVGVSQELRLVAGADDGPQAMLGLSSLRTRFDNRSRSLAPGGGSVWGPVGAVLLPDDEFGALDVRAWSRERALFGEVTGSVTPALRLSAGARAYEADVAYDSTLRVLGRGQSGTAATTDRGVTPRVTVAHGGERHLAYALVSTGYRIGGVNFDPPAFTPYRSDRLTNREVGVRLRLSDAVQAEVAAFRMDWRDAQVSALTTQPVPLIGVANVGRARSQGLEAGLAATAPTGTATTLRLAWIDARTRADFTTAAGLPVPSGSPLPGTPRWQLAAQVAHPLALGAGWSGELSADVQARSRRVEAIGRPATSAGQAILGLGLSARRGAWSWQLRLDNAGDVVDVAGVEVVERRGAPPFTDRYLSDPRRWSVSIRHEH